ncbi:MAG: hypothetical protein ACO3ST_09110, partial [Burkholderiaceae bacterium]
MSNFIQAARKPIPLHFERLMMIRLLSVPSPSPLAMRSNYSRLWQVLATGFTALLLLISGALPIA